MAIFEGSTEAGARPATNLRIAIDATPLLLRSAGVKTYVYYWALHLERLAGGRSVHLFPYLSALGEFHHEQSVLPRLATLSRLALLALANYTPLPVFDPVGARVDLFHSSHQLVRPPRRARITATLYDLTCWLTPEMHSASNVARAKEFARRVLTRADGVIAISEHTRADAIRILGLPPDKIDVIYPGVAPAFFDAPAARRPKPYILFVGTIEPRKNVSALLDAYEQLPASVRAEYDLVLAGSEGWGQLDLLRRLRSGIPGVHYLGYVAEADLPSLTAGATLFVYPSLYEGFGLPVAQAMAAGVPVITSNVSCLPEVAGGGALLVDPKSPAALCAALERLLLSPALRADLAANGRSRAQLYRWDVCAERSWRFFERVAG